MIIRFISNNMSNYISYMYGRNTRLSENRVRKEKKQTNDGEIKKDTKAGVLNLFCLVYPSPKEKSVI